MEKKQQNGSLTKIRKFNLNDIFKLSPEDNLREAARAYLFIAIQLYIKMEAYVSIWNHKVFGNRHILLCSLNRAIEHLLKTEIVKD